MPRSIGHILHKLKMRPELRLGNHLIQQCTQSGHHLQIAPLISSPNVVRLPNAAALEDGFEGSAMIHDVQPIPYLLAIAVYWESFTLKSIRNHQRNQFFWKLKRSIIVRTIRNDGG